MKIIHLTTIALSQQLLLLPQLLALRDAGYEVVAVSAHGPEVEVLERHGIRHRALDGSTRGFDLLADLRAARSFASIVREERPDLVHTHNPKPGIYGRIIARLLGTPVVVNTVHGLYATPDDSLSRRAAVYGLEAIASRFSHLELVQSSEDLETMRRLGIAPRRRLRFLGNGVDTSRFNHGSAADEVRAEVRQELGIGPDEVVVGSVGRLVAEKGFGELLDASERIDAPHRLIIAGPDDPEKADRLDNELIGRAQERGVQFLGHRDDVDRLLNAFDIFVLASYREGVPRVAMEAAASELPVIATDIRGCRQVVEHGVNGLLVPAREVDPLMLALEYLIGDDEARRVFGKAGRAKAEVELDEMHVIQRLFDGYRAAGLADAPVPSKLVKAA